MPSPKPQTKPVQQETDPIKIAIPLIKQNEGYKPKAYFDEIGKVWTIGTGITRYADGTPVRQGDTITPEKNDQELYNYLQKSHEYLKTRPAYSAMNPNQIASTLDLTFNTGARWSKAKNASLLEATSSPEKLEMLPDAMRKYNKAKGQVVQGLVNRRERAVVLFNTPYTPPVEPKNIPPDKRIAFVGDFNVVPMVSKDAQGNPTLDTRPSNL